jgi:serine protease Do
MRNWLVRVAVCLVVALARPAMAEDTGLMSAADLIAAVLPAVVNVSTVVIRHEPNTRSAQDLAAGAPSGAPGGAPGGAPSGTRVVHGLGSGFIIDPGGIVVTNRHVIENAVQITVTLQDNTTLRATRIGRLSRADVALLQVKPRLPLPVVAFGDSDRLRVGDPVIAIGNPLGLGGSVSSGIVSALNRDIRTTPFDDFIQTDAAINHGSSGGPLFDMKGKVVGINTAIYAPSDSAGSIGISFALPINDARFIVDQTLRYGRVRAGSLGLAMQSVTPDIADAIGLNIPRGSIVASLDADGPAAKVGVREGDVIMSVGRTTARDSREVWRVIARQTIGAPVELTVWRDGRVLSLSPVVEELPPPPGDADPADAGMEPASATAYEPGLRLATITGPLRARFRLAQNDRGVVVTDVGAETPAAERGVQPGDVILRAGVDPATTPAEVHARIAAARARKDRYFLLLLKGPGGQRFVTLPLYPDG